MSPLSSPLHTYETDQQVTCSSAQYTCALAAQHLSKRIRLDSVPAPCTAFHTCDVRCAEAKGIHCRPEEAGKLRALLTSPAIGFFYFCTGPPGGGRPP